MAKPSKKQQPWVERGTSDTHGFHGIEASILKGSQTGFPIAHTPTVTPILCDPSRIDRSFLKTRGIARSSLNPWLLFLGWLRHP